VIRLVEQRLETLTADAVVRAADALLSPLGAASVALDEAAGARFAEQRRVNAPLEVGSAVVTGGGDLAAEFVLHLVLQDEERSATRDILRRALLHAWHRAEGWQLSRVAAAAGGLALPLEEAAALLVETFRDRPGNTGFPAELLIVVDDAEQRGTLGALLSLPPA
jgi:O-acetyl-ADP-ribose deacetylase (regulator of RNase III)